MAFFSNIYYNLVDEKIKIKKEEEEKINQLLSPINETENALQKCCPDSEKSKYISEGSNGKVFLCSNEGYVIKELKKLKKSIIETREKFKQEAEITNAFSARGVSPGAKSCEDGKNIIKKLPENAQFINFFYEASQVKMFQKMIINLENVFSKNIFQDKVTESLKKAFPSMRMQFHAETFYLQAQQIIRQQLSLKELFETYITTYALEEELRFTMLSLGILYRLYKNAAFYSVIELAEKINPQIMLDMTPQDSFIFLLHFNSSAFARVLQDAKTFLQKNTYKECFNFNWAPERGHHIFKFRCATIDIDPYFTFKLSEESLDMKPYGLVANYTLVLWASFFLYYASLPEERHKEFFKELYQEITTYLKWLQGKKGVDNFKDLIRQIDKQNYDSPLSALRQICHYAGMLKTSDKGSFVSNYRTNSQWSSHEEFFLERWVKKIPLLQDLRYM